MADAAKGKVPAHVFAARLLDFFSNEDKAAELKHNVEVAAHDAHEKSKELAHQFEEKGKEIVHKVEEKSEEVAHYVQGICFALALH